MEHNEAHFFDMLSSPRGAASHELGAMDRMMDRLSSLCHASNASAGRLHDGAACLRERVAWLATARRTLVAGSGRLVGGEKAIKRNLRVHVHVVHVHVRACACMCMFMDMRMSHNRTHSGIALLHRHTRAQDGYATGWFGAAEQEGGGPLVVLGEKSPSYMYLPKVPWLMHAIVPHVKLLALLRNPIDRALSQWHMRMRAANQSEQVARVVTPDELIWDDELVARGRYAEQLQRFVSEGFSRTQLLVEIYEDFLLRQLNLSRVYSFLGVADQRPPSAARISELLGSYATQHVVIPRNDTRAVLRDHLACAVQELRGWLRDERPERLDLWTDFVTARVSCSGG
eukprot:4039183-Prymnesium_polylepis.1